MRVQGPKKIQICGDNSEEVTPVPIPNTEVKLLSADDTWWETAWESRSLPLMLKSNLQKQVDFFMQCTKGESSDRRGTEENKEVVCKLHIVI